MNKLCENCRFWSNDDWWITDLRTEPTLRRPCLCPKILGGDDADTEEPEAAAATDNEGYSRFESGPKFGCIHFALK